jgi:outer membrane protein assembly factor BamB
MDSALQNTSGARKNGSASFAGSFVTRLAVAAVIGSVAGAARLRGAERDWPCFRGPDRSGVAEDVGLPLAWSDQENVVWKTALPGPGASSPVTFGDRIYLTCYSGYGLSRESPGEPDSLRRHVLAIKRDDGQVVWNREVSNPGRDDRYVDFINLHGYASSTPAVDASGVYAFFGTTGVRAFDHDGRQKWEAKVGWKTSNFGSASSPVLTGDLVIVNAAVEENAIVALDKQTGREVWRTPTPGASRSTPLLIETGGSRELVFHLGESYGGGKADPSGLAAVDPADGRKLWECVSLNSYLNPSPIAHDGVIYAVGCHPNRAVAIRAGGRGDVTATHLVWDIKHGSEVGTPVFYRGRLYWANEESGVVYCVDAADGAVVYQERLNPRPGRIYASAVIADGKLYYVSRENGTYVLPAEPRFELLAHNVLAADGSVFNATPAVSRGQLLLRSDRFLYCIGRR